MLLVFDIVCCSLVLSLCGVVVRCYLSVWVLCVVVGCCLLLELLLSTCCCWLALLYDGVVC